MFDLLANSNCLMLVLAASEGEPKPLYVGVDLLLFTLVIFLVLLFVLHKYAWKPIAQGLDKRENRIADHIKQAELADEKAQATLAQYEERMKAAGEEAKRMMAEAKQEAERTKDRIVAEAAEEGKRQRDRAVAEINAAKNQAVRELAERSVDSAVTLAGSLVGKELSKTDHEKLIEQSLEQFSQSG